MKRLLYIFILLSGCRQATEKLSPARVSNEQPNTVFASYRSQPDNLVGSGLTLNSDSTYTYGFVSCLISGTDSGKYAIMADTIYFKSSVEDMVDTSNHWHDQIRPLTNQKFLLKNGRIYHWIVDGKYDMNVFWLKEGLETAPNEVLDSTGNGYASFYNGDRQITQRGLFQDFGLREGERYSYLPDGQIGRVEIYKYGFKIKDSIPTLSH